VGPELKILRFLSKRGRNMAKSSDGNIVMVDQLVASMYKNCRSDEYLVSFVTSCRQVTDYASIQPSPLHPPSFPISWSLITEQSHVIQMLCQRR